MKLCLLALALTLFACSNQETGNAMTNAAVPDGPMPAGAPPLPAGRGADCPLPKLEFGATPLDARGQRAMTDRFAIAFNRACEEGMFKDGPLVEAEARPKDTIVVIDAPEANVTSLYFRDSGARPAMILESPFGSPPQVPSADDLHEAIYCWDVGATDAEQEATGRCLPD